MTHTSDWESKYDIVDKMMLWEEGELSNEETIKLFQHLVDTGEAWNLQGCYGRAASTLIQQGYVHNGTRH